MGNQQEDLPSQKRQPPADAPDVKKKDAQPERKAGVAADEDPDMKSGNDRKSQ